VTSTRPERRPWHLLAVAAVGSVLLAGMLAANAGAAVTNRAVRAVRPRPAARVIIAPRPSTRRPFRGPVAVRRVITPHVLTATITSLHFPSTGGTFVVSLRDVSSGSRCTLSAGTGVTFSGTYSCGGALFQHGGRVLPNGSFVVKHWTVRVVAKTGSSSRTFAWVVTVAARTPPPTTTTTTTSTTTTSTTTTSTTTTSTTTTTTTIPTTTTTTPSGQLPGYQSANWSGYILQTSPGATTDVQGTWAVPTLNCASTPDGVVSEWVGVDGATNSDLFQTGSLSYCDGGTQVNGAWFEELPAAAYNFSFPVSAGDTISAHIWQVSSGEWNFTVTDETSGYEGYSSSAISYSGPENSAEWINEDPYDPTTSAYYPFADFGSVTFSAISTDLAAPALSLQSDGVEMVQSGHVLAEPSAPSGSGFTVTYG